MKVQSGHLNVFIPYENKPLHHEDQLTRAFLILLGSTKIVEILFIEILRERMGQSGITLLPPSPINDSGGVVSIETQISSSTKGRLQGENGRLVSVILTDELLKPEHRVERTGRVAIYDGFLRLKPNWVIVLENKPSHTNIWVQQLSSAFNEDYEIEPVPVVLSWRDVIRRLGVLITNDILQDGGKTLVEDFLAYVDNYFPELNPYESFELCGNHRYLLEKHCMEIMEKAGFGPVEYHRGWHYSTRLLEKPGIKEVALHPSSNSEEPWPIQLHLHPGDTMNQARDLFSSIKVDRVENLRERGWLIQPNFHVSFRSSNLYWCDSGVPLSDYLQYWVEEVGNKRLRQIARAEWNGYFAILAERGIISNQDAQKMEALLLPTAMSSVNICPGVTFQYTWSREDAIYLEGKGLFVQEYSDRVKDVLRVWGQ
jgi:hypothetical protein